MLGEERKCSVICCVRRNRLRSQDNRSCLNSKAGIRTAVKSKNYHAYKIAYLKCTLNVNSNPKNEAFSLNRSRENEGQSNHEVEIRRDAFRC